MSGRSSKRQPDQRPDPIAAVATNIGGNVRTETLKQHCSAIESAEADLKRAQQKLKTCWDGADHVAMLLRWSWAEGGVGNRASSKLHSWCLDEAPLARIYVAVNRVSMPPGDVAVEAKGGAVAFGWFVWEKNFKGTPTFVRLRKPAA